MDFIRFLRCALGVTAFGVSAAAVFAPATAHACGGLFCNSAQPVNQAAERILFAENGDGSITAVIEIQYQGPSEKFSWILPVPGVPEVDVSSVTAFDRLQQATNPLYQLNTTFEECAFAFGGAGTTGGTGVASSGASDAGAAEGPGVIVLATGTVGPFDYEVINVDPTRADPAQVALDWLMENGYDVTALGPDVLRPYLADGLNLLAFRLTKTANTGSIRPISITYDSDNPFIPIRPTAVAANDDMGILVWVVSRARAIPVNYKALELNDARIDWFNPMGTYNDVVTAAADEAGGQGFVTELSAPSGTLEEVIVQDYERSQWNQIQNEPYEDPLDLLDAVSTSFNGWDGLEDALRGAVTLPMGLDLDEFLGCPRCYADDPAVVIDQAALLKGLYEMVVKPMFDTDDLLLSRPYVTRLYTTMSADEMTMDPMFDTNPDLADVSNVHTADQLIKCDGGWEITLPQGGVVYGDQAGVWPDVGDQPANSRILQLTTSGQGKTIENNRDKIRSLLEAAAPAETPGVGGSGGMHIRTDGGATFEERDGGVRGIPLGGNACGCRVPGGASGRPITGFGWLALAALVLLRRRR